MSLKITSIVLLLLLTGISGIAQQDICDLRWRQVVYGQPDEWHVSEEAIRIAENELLNQQANRGWPKNTALQPESSFSKKMVAGAGIYNPAPPDRLILM